MQNPHHTNCYIQKENINNNQLPKQSQSALIFEVKRKENEFGINSVFVQNYRKIMTIYIDYNKGNDNSLQKLQSTETMNEGEVKEKSAEISLICHFFPCMKTFKSRENLDLHILNIHLQIKPFQCKYCERKFSHRNGKEYAVNKGKIYHERTKHLNYLPFNCQSTYFVTLGCFKKYASKTALRVHFRTKHM